MPVGGFIESVIVNPYVEIDRSAFPFTLPVLRDFQSLPLHPRVTLFCGENGSGKSTMLEAMALNYGMPAEGGSKQHSFSTFDSHTGLHEMILLQKKNYPAESFFFRAESFYNLASYVERAAREGGGGGPRFGFVHRRSHGEGFLDFMRAIMPNSLVLMDEPESALSAQGQLSFLAHLQRLVNLECQFVIASHSPFILGFPDAHILHFSPEGILPTSYEETDAYQLTLRWIRDPEGFGKMVGLKAEKSES
jgi:predicted ATPase